MDKLSLVHPAARGPRASALREVERRRLRVHRHAGLRTWEEQNALYAKGRTTPGPDRHQSACGGHSQHNFGLAVDVTLIEKGALDWNLSHPGWKRMLELAPSCALAEGAEWRTFPDNPHLYPVEIPATCEVLREKYAMGGMRGVWAGSSRSSLEFR
jgi:peptidoglycan L-alanyl-D-glutamate endopeptidase CwlK